ncbi:hypothetical protein GUJ93_ZPchr0013g34423 [Zizania palustris]|uniref:F-box/LRR-repeat protein 15/At3g58940/PEG3-like LRR domain-containing protein n=1 Tax=Zizania palustris TaxID=103762 RepID=A0A8J6C5H2_ZIZPA|nr:hypothetical protein GUJ93_ZPchr0013g34423 [Zizania palustris]
MVAATVASFPILLELTLRYAFTTSSALHGLLAGCPSLMTLSLDHKLQDLVIEEAPLLERLLGHDINWGPSIHVLHASRLEILSYLGVGIPSLQLGKHIASVRVAKNDKRVGGREQSEAASIQATRSGECMGGQERSGAASAQATLFGECRLPASARPARRS